MAKKPRFDIDHWNRWLNQEVETGNDLANYDTIKNYLRHGDRLRCPLNPRVVQCLILPTFDVWLSYEVFRNKDEYWLLRTICKLHDPRERPKMGEKRRMDFRPELVYKTCQIWESSIKSLMTLFRQPVISFEEGGIGMDGTSYELALAGSGFQQVRYSWWEEPTRGWQPLWAGFHALIAHFDSALELAHLGD